jgi:hypothetical protein
VTPAMGANTVAGAMRVAPTWYSLGKLDILSYFNGSGSET